MPATVARGLQPAAAPRYGGAMPPAATRFAPSPTGCLHLGHAWSALVAHTRARELGGRYLLRIDDIDAGRVRQAYRDAIDRDLAWLGLSPDEPPLVQSRRAPAYAAALEELQEAGLAYPCFCTRAEIAAAAAAPHGPAGPTYPGTCRMLPGDEARARIAAGTPHAWRLDMARAMERAMERAGRQGGRPSGRLTWEDERRGTIIARPESHGDIILARRDAPSSYHLASTLDDAAQGITLVVRGADLMDSTHVHRLLQALLGLPTPRYHHHALIGDAQGRRLAKRHDAASIASLREAGADPAMLVADLIGGRLPLGYRWLEA